MLSAERHTKDAGTVTRIMYYRFDPELQRRRNVLSIIERSAIKLFNVNVDCH